MSVISDNPPTRTSFSSVVISRSKILIYKSITFSILCSTLGGILWVKACTYWVWMNKRQENVKCSHQNSSLEFVTETWKNKWSKKSLTSSWKSWNCTTAGSGCILGCWWVSLWHFYRESSNDLTSPTSLIAVFIICVSFVNQRVMLSDTDNELVKTGLLMSFWEMQPLWPVNVFVCKTLTSNRNMKVSLLRRDICIQCENIPAHLAVRKNTFPIQIVCVKQCIRCVKALNRTTVAYIWIPGRNISIKPLKNERWRSAHHHAPPPPVFSSQPREMAVENN